MRQKHSVRSLFLIFFFLFSSFLRLTPACRNPIFFPSDRNTFFFFLDPSLTSTPTRTFSFWDHDSVGARDEIGQVTMSFHMLPLCGDRCPSGIISLPIIIHKPKLSPVRGFVDLRYGLVSVAPPLPASELLSPASSQQQSPFIQYLQRRIRFLQVAMSHNTFSTRTTLSLSFNPPSRHLFSQKYDPASLMSVHADAWAAFVSDSHEASMQILVNLWGPEP